MTKCILAEQGGRGGGSSTAIVPTKLTITANPTKTVYRVDDNFSLDGFKGVISYGAQGSALEMGTATIPEQVALSQLVVSPNRPLQESDTKITVSYSENDITVSVDIPIVVKSSNLNVTPPTKSTYAWGEEFNTTGLVVETLDGNPVTNYTMKIGSVELTNGMVLNNTNFVIGGNTVNVSATDSDGIEQDSFFELTLTKATLTVPAQDGTLTYDPDQTSQTPSWDSNYKSSLMTVTVVSKKDAGTYDAVFDLTDKNHYQWIGATTDEQTIQWTIEKKTLEISDITISGDKTIDADHLTRVITITTPAGETGEITISPMSATGITVEAQTQTANSRQFTFTGVKDNPGSINLTVNVADGKNYTSGTFENCFKVTAQYWEWGTDGGTVDAAWFTGLKNYLASNSGSSLKTSDNKNILGTTKSVTLGTAVLGTTTHLIRVIGVDQDADNTVTFQTKNCLNEYTTWSTTAYNQSNKTAAKWTDANCKAKAECVNYYNAFPGKDAIKTIKKGTCPDTNDSRNGTPTYQDETVFLLSEREFGLDTYSPLSTANSTTNKAECTQGKNFSYAFYTSNETRIMGKGDASTAKNDGYPWERSRYYVSSSSYPTFVCAVYGNGRANRDVYDYSTGLAPAFVIGN